MPDLPKYIGIEGSHTDFEDFEDFTLGEQCTLVHGNEAPVVSVNLNSQFAKFNENWNDDGGKYPHISDMYVRTRDVMPLLKLARSLAAQLTGPANAGLLIETAELVRCLDYLKDLE